MSAETVPGVSTKPMTAPLSVGSKTDSMLLLQRFAEATGVPFDPIVAEQAVHRAEREIPPTEARAARKRLAQAAESVGILLVSRQLSIREAFAAVEPDSPLALFAVTTEGTARWFLLVDAHHGAGRFAKLAPDADTSDVDVDAFARMIGVADGDAVVEWLIAQPLTPFIDSLAGSVPVEQGEHHGHGVPPTTRLWGLILSEKYDVSLVVLYSIGVGILSLAIPVTAMAVVNTAAMATLLQQLIVLCVALFLSLGVAAVLHCVQNVVVEFLQQRIFVRVVADLAYRLPRIELKAYDRHHGPELVNRFFDVLTVQKATAILLLDGISVILHIAIGLLLLAFYHHLLLAFAIILLSGLLFIVFVLGRGALDTAIRESLTKYEVAGWLEEIARHPVAFKLHGGPRFAQDRADALAREYLLARQEHFWILLRQFMFTVALQVTASTALLGLGGFLVIQEQLTLGQLVAAEIVVTLVVASFTKLSKQLENYYDLLAAVDKLGHLLELPLERQTGEAHQARTKGASVRIHNVSFAYDTGRRPVLDGFELDIQPGERLAIVGPNGSGKSTLADLLFGTTTPTDGHITIDDADLRDVRLQSLREHVAIVKGIEIFDGTILENIRMGRDEMSFAEVRRALTAVGLLEDVLDLPDGLNTRLGTGGTPLSLGQCERLMLARAIAGQPRLLILDEVLDDMDREVRSEVMPAIFGKEALWTLIVITHSKEVAQLCDRQVVIRKASRARAKEHHEPGQNGAK